MTVPAMTMWSPNLVSWPNVLGSSPSQERLDVPSDIGGFSSP